MYAFTLRQQWRALCWLSFFHILVIAASNYLVQIPFTIYNAGERVKGNWDTTTKAFTELPGSDSE